MGKSSKILLDLESNKSTIPSSLESRLLLSNNVATDLSLQSQTTKSNPPDFKPTISSVPKSEILGKLKNFLPVMLEANKSLQLAAMDNSKHFNIEALEDNESAHIEMDLMLGVAELHTPEAIAAAESAIEGHLPVIPLAASHSSDDDDNSGDDDDNNSCDDDDNNSCDEDADDADDNGINSNEEDDRKVVLPIKTRGIKHAGDASSEVTKTKSGKRPKIIELS